MSLSVEEKKALDDLYSAILSLKSVEEMHLFFMDLCSRNELTSMLHRWQILRLIDEGKSYEEIIQALTPGSSLDQQAVSKDASGIGKGKDRSLTRVSSTTISRVKACYNNPDGGYQTALRRLKGEEE